MRLWEDYEDYQTTRGISASQGGLTAPLGPLELSAPFIREPLVDNYFKFPDHPLLNGRDKWP